MYQLRRLVMRKKNIKNISVLFCFCLFVLITSCESERSSATGWEYNNSANGGFQKVPYEEQETGPGLIFIEGGTFTMGRVEQDVTYDWDNAPRRVTVSSFYLDETEVTNFHWLEYLYWIRRTYESFPMVYKNALPDTLSWREKLGYMEPYVEYYLRHPAYRDYPVVGVSWLQANNFCKWRTDRVNEYILIREGILNWNPFQVDEPFTTDSYFAGQYDDGNEDNQLLPDLNPSNPGPGKRGRKRLGQRNVRMEDGILLPRYRLPTEAEWEYASYGLVGQTFQERIVNRRLYPWTGHWLRNPSEKWQGSFMANFVRGRGDYMGVAGKLNDNADVTAPVTSYWPNDYGLYCMAGNVSEWVLDVYRPLSQEDYDEFRPFRGNLYKTKKLTSAGSIDQKYDEVVYALDEIKEYLIEFEAARKGDEKLTGNKIIKDRLTPIDTMLLGELHRYVDNAIELRNDQQYIAASQQVREIFDAVFEDFDIRIQTDSAHLAEYQSEISPMLRKGISDLISENDIPGRVKWREVTQEENLHRRNYKTADNVDYLDGDLESSHYYNSEQMINRINQDGQPINGKRVEKNLAYQSTEDKTRGGEAASPTSLISDKSRVYKGGSWRDRAYWMNGGTRRYLDEDQATATIGFRCCMDRVGSPTGMGKYKR